MKKTAFIILIVALLFNNFSSFAYASNDYDHDELMQYEGYGQAMYESIVEQTTFVTGQYTDNKEYVSNSMGEIKSYADFWYNEYTDFTSGCYQSSAMNCLGDMAERGGAYVLTVGDWIKNLFSDYDEEFNNAPLVDHEFYNQVFINIGAGNLIVNEGWKVHATFPSGSTGTMNKGSGIGFSYSNGYYTVNAAGFNEKIQSDPIHVGIDRSTVYGSLSVYEGIGMNFIYEKDGVIQNPNNGRISPTTALRDYVRDNPVTVPVPQLKPLLVCPDGKRILMSISGSTFIAVDGTVMAVAKDGTAELNGEICNLNWQKPTVEYDPVTGKPIIKQPDGTKTDLGDGESTIKPPSSTDLEGCDGIMCAIGKLLDGLGVVVKAIAGLVTKILDGILALFVPEDLNFISTEFTRITNKLTEKIAITENLKEMITSVFDGGSTNPLQDISLNLPITNEPLKFGEMSIIEEGVPILRKVISGIVVLYTLLYVYRKITGRGGVMEK